MKNPCTVHVYLHYSFVHLLSETVGYLVSFRHSLIPLDNKRIKHKYCGMQMRMR